MGGWWLFVATGVMLVLIMAAGSAQQRKRRAGLAEEAVKLGFSFAAASDVPVAGRAGLALLAGSTRPKICNVLCGSTPVGTSYLFDYSYVVPLPDGDHTRSQTVAAFHLEGSRLPQLAVCPEGLLAKLESASGGQDIDFDSHPEFSRRFLVRGPDEVAVRSLLAPEVIAAIEGMNNQSLTHLESDGEWLLAYRAGHRVEPGALRMHLEAATDVASAFAARAKA